MNFDLKTKLARMEQVKQEKPGYKGLLNFYEKIFVAKAEFYQSLKFLRVDIDEQFVQKNFKAGLSVLDKRTIELDIKALEKFFLKLLRISQEKNPETVGRLSSLIEKGDLDVGTTLKQTWDGKITPLTWKKKVFGDPTLLNFLFIETLKPVYEYLADNLAALIDVTHWEKGYCPICGETPPIAVIPAGEWSRLLFCVFCGMEWPFPFLMCPFCGNEEEKGIKYLVVKNEKQYRIEVCKACHKYLKVVDSVSLGYQVPLDIENLITLHLDMLAQREGYHRGAQYPLLI